MNKKDQLDNLLGRPPKPTDQIQSTSSNQSQIQEEIQVIEQPSRSYSNPPFQNLRFDDIKSAFKTFKGDKKHNIHQWIIHFEEQATVFQLSEIQKFIFAKRVLEGAAKLFVEYESKATTWNILKAELEEEFGEQLNSATIHHQLSERKKKSKETFIEYFYEMLAIGSRGNVEHKAIITYTIDGLPGSTATKNFMYDARTIKDFKQKLETFELMQPKMTNQPKNIKNNDYQGKRDDKSKNDDEQRCRNCGDKSHNSNSCPNKDKGPKCFKCNSYGHLSRFCTSTQPSEPRRINIIQRESSRKHVTINNSNVKALIDTGSDITGIKESTMITKNIKRHIQKVNEPTKGIGGFINIKEKFNAKICIDNEIYETDCFVLPDKHIDDELIVGLDIINQSKLTMTENGIEMKKNIKKLDFIQKSKKPKKNSNEIENLLNIFYIGKKEQEEIDLTHITDSIIKSTIKSMIYNYKPTQENACPIEMEILLSDEKPIALKPKRMAISEKAEVDKQIDIWLKDDVIEPSYSDFSANLVIVPKKDGTKRMCVDFRQINKKIIKDRFPMPLIEDQLDQLQSGTIFTTLDLTNGFLHVPMKKESRMYTAFVTHSGQYEFKRVPFGLCNSPAVFCRFINVIFRPLITKGIMLTYMDDIIIIATNMNEAIERLDIVLTLAASYNLNIKWKKCSFFHKKITFLGYEIENGKIGPSKSKVKDIHKYKEPKNVKEVQRFLGFTGYFRKFINNYALTAKPLSDLTRNDTKFIFGSDQKIAFETLKNKICKQPVLMIYNKDAETELHTDASKYGTAGILMQKNPDDNQFHPVHYISHKTSAEQEKWISYELELFAIYLAVMKFRNYLLDIHFKIVTDCQALKTAMNKKDVRKIATWLMELQPFNFEIVHRQGSQMQHVDALSRMYVIQTPSLLHNMKKAQYEDEHIMTIIEVIKVKPYNDYVIYNGLLCKFSNSKYTIVVPEAMEMNLILKIHQEGHFKYKKLEALINNEFYIKNLQQKVEKVVNNCIECILAEKKTGKKEGMLHPINKEPIPLDTFHLDHLGPMPSTNKNYNHIFAIVDSFTKFVWLFPVKSTTAIETVDKLKVITNIFGNPRRVITDKGTAFTSLLFKDFCKDENINHIFTTTGVPRGNGQIERINRIIINVLTKLSIDNPENWYKHVNNVQKCINNSYQRAIKMTPFELMFGVHMKQIENEINEIINEEIIDSFTEERKLLRSNAKLQIEKISNENRKTFNQKRKKAHNYKIDDLVAITKTQFSTGAKIKPKLHGPYKVIKSVGNERYEIEKLGQHDGPSKTSTSADNMKPWPTINTLTLMNNENPSTSYDSITSKDNQTKRQFTILIEGNIGTGKSTFLKHLEKFIDFNLLPEPVPHWTNLNGYNLLANLYENPKEWLFPFQSFATLTLYKNHVKKVEKKYKIMERSILSTKHCFVEAAKLNNKLPQAQYDILQKWYEFLEENIKIEIDLIIYLKCEPEICFNRIKKRGRPEEINMSLSHLDLLNKLHNKWLLENNSKIPVVVIDSNLNEDLITSEYDKVIDAILNLKHD